MKNKQINIILLTIIVLLILTSCETQTLKKVEDKIEALPAHLISRIDVNELEILKIDSCEYIFYKKSPNRNMGFGFMAHKGNCKNPIHYYSRNKTEK